MNFFLVLFYTLIISSAYSQLTTKWDWTTSTKSQNHVIQYADCYIDSEGNTYAVGHFSSSSISMDGHSAINVDRAPILQICIGVCPSRFSSDIFISKINKQGQTVWMQTVQGKGSQLALSINANELGEVWIIGSTDTNSIYINSMTKELDDTHGNRTSKFIVKLDNNGLPLFIEQLDSPNIQTANNWLFINNNTLSLFGIFTPTPASNSDFFGKANFNASTGEFLSFQEIWQPVDTTKKIALDLHDIKKYNGKYFIHAGTTDEGIQLDGEKIEFESPEGYQYYVLSYEDQNRSSDLFTHQLSNRTYPGKIAVNDSLIAIASYINEFPDYENLLHIGYFDYFGSKRKEHIIPNTSQQPNNLSLDAIVILENSQLIATASVSQTIEFNDQNYEIPPSVYDYPNFGTLINQHKDIFLLNFNYEDGLNYVEHIEGSYLPEQVVELETFDSKIRMIASYESEQFNLGGLQVENKNDEWFQFGHHEPIANRRYNDLVFAEFEFGNINGIENDKNSSIIIYPNPSNGNVTIQINTQFNLIELYTFTGQLMYSGQQKNLNFDQLESGNYLVKIIGEDLTSTRKLFVK